MWSANRTHLLFVALCLTALLLIGAGCGDDETETPAAAQQVVVKKPANETNPFQIAYDRCLDEGYSVRTEENEKGEATFYCVFPGNTGCELTSYTAGACHSGSGAITLTSNIDPLLEKLRSCTSDSPPVCGDNGKNYVNECVAAVQGIPVKHEGLCLQQEVAVAPTPVATVPTPSITPATPSSAANPPPASTGVTAAPKPTVPPSLPPDTPAASAWLSLVMDLLSGEPAATPRAQIEKCVYQNTLVYYTDSGALPGMLYSSDGSLICYPDNNLNNLCPSFFKVKNRSTNCSVIWKDKR